MIASSNRSYYKARLILTAMFLLILLYLVNFVVDLKPNSLLVNLASSDQNFITEIYYNTGQGYSEEPLTSGEVSDVYAENLKSLRIDIKREPLLEKHNFVLQSVKTTDKLIKSTWSSIMPGFSYDFDQAETFVLPKTDQDSSYELFFDDKPIMLKKTNGSFIADVSEISGYSAETITIKKISKKDPHGYITEPLDIRDLSLGIDAVYVIEKNDAPLAIESIEMIRKFGRIGLSFPLKVWSAQDVFEVLKPLESNEKYWLDNNKVAFQAAFTTVELEFNLLSTELNREISNVIARYTLILNAAAIALTVLFYFASHVLLYIPINQTSVNKFNDKYKNISNNIELSEVSVKKIIEYLFLSMFFFAAFVPITNSLFNFILIALTIILGYLVIYANSASVKLLPKESDSEESSASKNFGDFRNQLTNFTVRIKYNIYQDKTHVALLLLVSFLFLYFGTQHLGQFMSVDEPKWLYTRVPQLYEALLSGNWGLTYINDKPGVLPSLLAGITNFFLDLNDYGPHNLEDYLFWWRFPVLFFNFLMLFPIYYFTRKLLNKDYALLTTALIALNPIIIGISQIVNPDATLWSVSFLAFITFMLYIKTNKPKYIWYCGIFFGLALISKYFVSIFYILFFLLIYIEYLINRTTKRQLFQRCMSLGKLYLISIIVYIVLFPATWVDPYQIIKGTFGTNILNAGLMYFLLFLFLVFFEVIILDGRISQLIKNRFLLEEIMLCFVGITLFIYFGFLLVNINTEYQVIDLSIIFNRGEYPFFQAATRTGYNVLYTLMIFKLPALIITPFMLAFHNNKNDSIQKTLFLCGSLMLFIFIGGSSLGGFVALPRYLIILYPVYCIIASLLYLNYFKPKLLVSTFLILMSLLITYHSTPYHLHYNNLLNNHQYVTNPTWGYGSYELAKKLNTYPDAEKINVWVDSEGFAEFFVGNHYWRGNISPFEVEDIDYLILTYGGERIFRRADYNEAGMYYDYIVKSEGQLLDYYDVEPIMSHYILGNRNNYIRVVSFDKH